MVSVSGHPGERALESVPAAAVDRLVATLRGDVVLPGHDEYDQIREVWNATVDRHPAVVARCAGVADVQDALAFARDHGLPVAVRGGGHNVAGGAVCDGGVVVDLSEMRGVRVDPERQVVRAEGGATLGDVDRETQAFGLATPLGVVSKTGIAGLTLNGGVGHLRRERGLACDALRSVDVVTADGAVHVASEDRNEDLLWAARGGGGRFGVVTSFEYDLHEVGPEVYGLFVVHHGDVIDEALREFRRFTARAPRTASVLAFTGYVPEEAEFPTENWGDPMIAFLGCYDGDPGEGASVLEPLRELADPVADFSGAMEYVDLQSMLDEEYPDGLRYYWKATYLDELTDEVVDLVVEYNDRAPSTLSTVDVWHLGGAIADLDPSETAYWHRGASYMLTFEANWEDPAADARNVRWAREGISDFRDLPVAAGGYGNFPGYGEDPAREVLGGNYDRLTGIRERYDPDDLFRSRNEAEV